MKMEHIVNIFGGLLSLVSIFATFFLQNRNSRKLEVLKTALEQEKARKQEEMKWKFSHQTDLYQQQAAGLKEFLFIVQQSKDKLRGLLKSCGSRLSEENKKQLDIIHQTLIDKYAATRYHLDSTPFGEQAHAIKGKLLIVTTVLLSGDASGHGGIPALINEVTDMQMALRKGIEQELRQRYYSIQNGN